MSVAMIDGAPEQLLGRHVSRRAKQLSLACVTRVSGRLVDRGRRGIVLDGLRDPEIQHLDEPVGRDHHVARLEVAVRDIVSMCFDERSGNLAADLQGATARHRSPPQLR